MSGAREAVLAFPVPEGVREVAVLPEACFVRQRDVLPFDRVRAARVTLIGAGAVGGFAALAFVKMGICGIDVYDHDTVSPENLGPQWFRPADLGRPKVEALADRRRRRPHQSEATRLRPQPSPRPRPVPGQARGPVPRRLSEEA